MERGRGKTTSSLAIFLKKAPTAAGMWVRVRGRKYFVVGRVYTTYWDRKSSRVTRSVSLHTVVLFCSMPY